MPVNHLLRTFGLVAILSTLTATSAFAQSDQPTARLIVTFDPFVEEFQEAISNVEGTFDLIGKQGDRLAIRVCSRDPIPVALALSGGRPFFVADKLKANGFPMGELAFLRSGRCSLGKTEFWHVPKGAKQPGFAEWRRVDDVILVTDRELGFDSLVGESSVSDETAAARFASNLKTLAEYLRKESSAIVVFGVASYSGESAVRANQRARRAVRFLRARNVNPDRIFVKRTSLGAKAYKEFSSPVYPEVFVVKK